jgi:hypothetical protein
MGIGDWDVGWGMGMVMVMVNMGWGYGQMGMGDMGIERVRPEAKKVCVGGGGGEQ